MSVRPGPSCWAPLASLAARQHGVVTVAQLRALGLSGSVVAKRRGRGELHRIYPGVYAVGHIALSREGRWLAAVFAAGPGAVLCRKCAAALLRIERWTPPEPEVLVPRWHRPIAGVKLYTTRSLDPRDVTVVNGIPCDAERDLVLTAAGYRVVRCATTEAALGAIRRAASGLRPRAARGGSTRAPRR